ncbi:MAG: phosphoenolpyruvate synthase [Candidatus Diapherotrites archaeon]|nr:phosphoenolpyruvate synthase [Candidatus Diapherotrites archaeon]
MGFIQTIAWFRELGRDSIPIAGGKGANLGEMFRAGFPVPAGFVVTAQAYFEFINSTGIKAEIVKKIDAIDVEKTRDLEDTSSAIRELIINTPMSQKLKDDIRKSYLSMDEKKILNLSTPLECFVAVRSSATAEDLPEASFAGQQETFVNIKGANEVVEAVKKCWASLFTARAVYYRKKQGFGTEKVGIAVVVQKMVNSEKSGIIFTAEPQTGDLSKIMIEAIYGQGEAIVSGSITPDTYVVSKEGFKILDKKIVKQEWLLERGMQGNNKENVPMKIQSEQKLTDPQIIELAKYGLKSETHYGKPQDMEFAVEKGRIFIVQTRPITTINAVRKVQEEEKIETREKPILKGLPASPGIAFGNVRVVLDIKDIGKVKEGDILCTVMTNPDWVPAMRKAKAIITNEGGITAHAAIVSRELGIPCVVGTGTATEILKDGQAITVDGFKGNVYAGKIALKSDEKSKEKVREEMKAEQAKLEMFLEEAIEEGEAKEFTINAAPEKIIEQEAGKELKRLNDVLDKVRVKVKVNVALPDAAQKAADTGADGVGLLRAEHMITSSGMHPAEFIRQGKYNELVSTVKKGIRAVAEKFPGKQVWYRTFDARTDEFKAMIGGDKEPKEENPMLGWHGIRRDIDDSQMLKAQFMAIKELRKEGIVNVGIMLPFLTHIEQLRAAKKLATELGLKPLKEVEFGVMVETPASVWIIDDLINDGISFISFGTNDLTQLTLGIDRNNEKIQKIFTELHPAVLKQCAYVIERCRKNNVQCSICGQAGSNPEMVKKLVRMGISSVSANIDSVEKIKTVVAEEEQELIKKTLDSIRGITKV